MVSSLRRAAFIDRDGVINEERNYIWQPEDFVFLPGAIAGLRKFQSLGFYLIVVTNQSGIARGLYSDGDYQCLTEYMREQLLAEGVSLTAVYHCPHHPDYGRGQYKVQCECRKPRPGMLLRARNELGIDLSRSLIVGDKLSDIGAGRAAGLQHCILVRTGHSVSEDDIDAADACCNDLHHASLWIASQMRHTP